MNTFTLTLLFETLGCKLSPVLLLLLEPAEENSYYLKASNHSPEHVQVCKWQVEAYWQQACLGLFPELSPATPSP